MFYNHSSIIDKRNYKEELNINPISNIALSFSLLSTYSVITISQVLNNCGAIFVGGFQDTVGVDNLPTMIRVAKRVAELGDYSAIYTTVVTKGNKKKIDILQQAGFKLIRSSGIKNTRSGNKIYLMVLEIK